MKKILLWTSLFTLVGNAVYADPIQSVTPTPQTPSTLPTAPAPSPQPGQNLPSVQPAQPASPEINCEYKVPPETKTIDQSLVLSWSEKAVAQSFTFDPINLDTQIQKLQPCFTEQGWTGFNTALQKSGNLEAIKSQRLTVSSQVEGAPIVTEAKDNQWKITLPLQVVYQNDKEKVTQSLSIDLTVTRKITGDLGITQMIAAPKGTVKQEKSDASSNTSMNPSPNTAPLPSPTGSTPTPSTQPTFHANPSAQPSPAPTTPSQPTFHENPSTQPSPSANNPR